MISKTFSPIVLFLCSTIILFVGNCGKISQIFIHNGESSYVIVISEGASPSEIYGAKELQFFLKDATRAELPIINETDPRSNHNHRICIGRGKIADKLIARGKQVNWETLGDEGFIIRSLSSDIVIAGGRLRGTLYGVYTFLDKLGFKWYTASKTVYPQDPILTVPALAIESTPVFSERELYFDEAGDGNWAARNRVNGRSQRLTTEQGGKIPSVITTDIHTLIPDSLFTKHPEYFPFIGGERTIGYVQRCLSNPDVIRICSEKILALMDANPDVNEFTIFPADIENNCECENCRSIIEEQGAYSGLDVYFMNKIAEFTENKYPDKLVGTLAYRYSLKPPKNLKPHRNVVIRLCPIEMCLVHPVTECTSWESKGVLSAIEGWTHLTNRVKIWHYGVNFSVYLSPIPNFREDVVSLREYQKYGIKEIFYQGGTFGSADSDLKIWVLSRLLWDPNQSVDDLVNEWLHGVYGAAYQPMRAYFDLEHAQVAPMNRHLFHKTPPNKDFWPNTVVASMDSLHTAALSLAKNDSIAAYYVKKNLMVVKYLNYITNTGQLQAVDGVYKPVGSTVTVKDFNRLIVYINRFGVSRLGEGDGDSPIEQRLRRRVMSFPIVTIENTDIRLDVVPELGGRIVSLIDKKTGTNILNNDSRTLHYPDYGGYEEWEELVPAHTGFSNPYTAEVQGRKITLTCNTFKNLLFTRTINLPPQGMRVEFVSSITNKNTTKYTYGLECRMHFHADPAKISVSSRTGDRSFIKPTPTEIFYRLWPNPGVSYRYDGVNKPHGAWRLENLDGGYTIENNFKENQVKTCRLITEDGLNMAHMEIHSPTRIIPPGGKITIEHTWEIIK